MTRNPASVVALFAAGWLCGCTGDGADSAPAAPAFQASEVFASEVRTLDFPSGMRAVLARVPRAALGDPPRVFVGLYVRYGTASQPAPEVAHLAEHIAANNVPQIVDYEVPEDLMVYGSNAMTRADYTSLWRSASPEGVAPFVPHRANRVVGVRNDPAVYEREVGRVIGEMESARRDAAENGRTTTDALNEAYFGPRPSREAVAESLRGLDSRVVLAELEKYYRPDNAVLVVAGDIDFAEAERIVQRHLSGYPARPGPDATPGPAFVPYTAPLVVSDARTSSTRVGLGIPLPDRATRDFTTALVLDQLLLGGRETRDEDAGFARSSEAPLVRRLRAGLSASGVGDGVDYRTDAPPLATQSPSYLGTLFTVPPTVGVDSIAGAVAAALRAVLDEELTDEAVEAAKRSFLDFTARWMLSDDLLALGDHLSAFALIDGDAARLNRLPSDVMAVTPGDVRDLLADIVVGGRYRLAIVSPP